jgi:hypothetical protein
MSHIIDRRASGKNKSADNRQRFLRRFKQQIKKAVSDAVAGRSVEGMDKGEKVTIPSRDLQEPVFRTGQGGHREMGHPGNKEFSTGDRIQRPEGGAGSGSGDGEASDQGEGMDDFAFELTREEFLNYFFEDLALPDLVKKQLQHIPSARKVRAGYSSDGNPANLHVVRSLRSAIGRRLAMSANPRKELAQLEEELEQLEALANPDKAAIETLKARIEELKARIAAVPFIDTFDLRYSNQVERPTPTSQAVMFCIMDVSGSMNQQRKDVAKRFFMLLHLFLTRNYDRIEVVFIRHHTVAREVDEHDFFHSRETGGTVVSNALTKMADIARQRYPQSEWNLYVAQASDGDNYISDTPRCSDILTQRILPAVQYFAYIEIMAAKPQSLWHAYEEIRQNAKNFAMRRINSVEEIFPVFRDLFQKETS